MLTIINKIFDLYILQTILTYTFVHRDYYNDVKISLVGAAAW